MCRRHRQEGAERKRCKVGERQGREGRMRGDVPFRSYLYLTYNLLSCSHRVGSWKLERKLKETESELRPPALTKRFSQFPTKTSEAVQILQADLS